MSIAAESSTSVWMCNIDSTLTVQLEEQTSALHMHVSPQEHISLPLSFVCNAADIYTRIFRATGDETAIDVALGLYRAALAAFTQLDSPECLLAMNCLAYALRISFDRRRIPAELGEAILLSREAVDLSSSSSSEAMSLWNLGASLRVAYKNLSGYTVDHLREAILVLRQAVGGHPHFGFSHLATVDLGSSLIDWKMCSGDQEALFEATTLLQRICDADNVKDADRIYSAALLMQSISMQIYSGVHMSTSLVKNYLCLGKTCLMLQGDWQSHLILMQTLAYLFRVTCEYHGNISDIDEAASLLRTAVQLDSDYICRRPQVLGDLGLTLHTRFILTGSEKDLEDAMKYLCECCGVATSDSHRVSARVALSGLHLQRFEIYHNIGDIQECVKLAHEARQLVPAQLGNEYSRQASAMLGAALLWQYHYVGSSCEDLHQVISYLRELLDTCGTKAVDDVDTLCDLGWALRLHYKDISQDEATLAKAREYHKEALSLVGLDQHNRRSLILFHLVQDSLAGFAVNRDLRLHDEAMDLFWKLMANWCLVARYRFEFCSTIVIDFGCSLPVTATLDICHHALSLLPQIAYLGLETNAPAALSQAPQLATLAAKCAISVGQVTKAVESIELGRAIFWSKALQLRIPCDDIPGDLADEFFQLSRRLEGLSRLHSHTGILYEEQLPTRRTIADRYEELLGRIRNIPGHEDFLLPHSFQTLRAAAQGGFIAMLSPAEIGYNAIIFDLTSDAPKVVNIPNVTTERLVVLSNRFNREIEWLRARDAHQFDALAITEEPLTDRLQMTKRRERESTVETLLAELWRTVVQPVIEALQVPSRPRSTDRPHLFWCPTGSYVSIPLHAAGIYTAANGPCAADYVIQSYTPTVSALLHAQRPEHPDVAAGWNTLLVAQPSAPGYAALPNTVREIKIVANLIGESHMLGADDPHAATVQAVSSALSSASIVHLACHGKQDKEALRSGFVMNDGLLTVDELMRLELPNARFAFLSACHAAAINPENPPDEVIHLAATMLYSGFRSVIATMWSMNDADGPTVAREVYTEAFKDGHLDLSRVPYALDAAVQKLKDGGVPASRWATYIHMGA